VHDAIRAWPDLFRGVVTGDPDDAAGERVLDLSCGSGEVTDALLRAGVPSERVDACDPYTGEAFEKRHPGKKCFDWSFEDIARGDVADRKWRVAVCVLRHAPVRAGLFADAGDDARVLVRRAHRAHAAQKAGAGPELGVHVDGGEAGRGVADTREAVR